MSVRRPEILKRIEFFEQISQGRQGQARDQSNNDAKVQAVASKQINSPKPPRPLRPEPVLPKIESKPSVEVKPMVVEPVEKPRTESLSPKPVNSKPRTVTSPSSRRSPLFPSLKNPFKKTNSKEDVRMKPSIPTQRQVEIVEARPSVAAPYYQVKKGGSLLQGKWTTDFDEVKAIIFHHDLTGRIFGGGGYLMVKEGNAEYLVLVAPKNYQHWLSSAGNLNKESPHITCLLERGREQDVKHNVSMLKFDSQNSHKTAPQQYSIASEELFKYGLISKDKMDKGLQSVRLLSEKSTKSCYNELKCFSGNQSPLLLGEITKTLSQ